MIQPKPQITDLSNRTETKRDCLTLLDSHKQKKQWEAVQPHCYQAPCNRVNEWASAQMYICMVRNVLNWCIFAFLSWVIWGLLIHNQYGSTDKRNKHFPSVNTWSVFHQFPLILIEYEGYSKSFCTLNLVGSGKNGGIVNPQEVIKGTLQCCANQLLYGFIWVNIIFIKH